MTNNNLAILVLKSFILCALFSCKNSSEKQISYRKLSINESNLNTSFVDYFKLKQVIRLETNENSNVGEIDRILFTKDKIFIVDKITKSILAFNLNGDYSFTIKNVGKGPGEYIDIGDVEINENEDVIYIVDKALHKIIKYNINGKFVSEKTCKYPVSEFKIINNSLLYYFRNSSRSSLLSKNSDSYYNLFIERNGKIVFKGCPFYKELRGFYFHVRYTNAIVLSNDICYVLEPLNNVIYKLSENKLEEIYKIDFGRYEIPEETKKSRLELDANINKYCHSIRNIYEDSTILFFMYNKQDYSQSVIYSKPLFKPQKCDAFIDEVNGLPLNLINARGLHHNMLSLLEPLMIKEHYDEIILEKKHVPQVLKDLVQHINFNDNPILVLYER